jgi:DNA replication protein DnaC
MNTSMKKTSKMKLMQRIELILKNTKSCRLHKSKLEVVQIHLHYLSIFLNINKDQCLLFAIIYGLNSRQNRIDLADIADHFKISALRLTSLHFKNLESLCCEGLIKQEYGRGDRKELSNISYFVDRTIQDTILYERMPQKQKLDSKDTLGFLSRFDVLVKEKEEFSQYYDEFFSEFEKLLELYSANEFVKKIDFFNFDDFEKLAIYHLFHETLAGDPEVDIDSYYKIIYSDQKRKYMMFRNFIHRDSNRLFSNSFVEHEAGFFRSTQFLVLTDHALQYFLQDEGLYQVDQKNQERDLLHHSNIQEVKLFFNPRNQEEIDFLSQSMDQKQYKSIQNRLKQENLRTGINILFYGSPGTGKTELAFQIAKQNQRSIMQVDISKLKSMWYGESQKLLKNMFSRYNRLVTCNRITPILLFNEADAYFSSRMSNITSSVDQTSNALQNIILEEMENHQGIIIATTNLTSNLDTAMERRFLFKVNFHQPNAQTKYLIWKDKLPDIDTNILKELASSYDLSGGQIENVVRKYQMNKVLGKNIINAGLMHTFCQAENFSKISRIGF